MRNSPVFFLMKTTGAPYGELLDGSSPLQGTHPAGAVLWQAQLLRCDIGDGMEVQHQVKLNLVVDFTFHWHARGFEHIGVLSDQVGPTGRLRTHVRLRLPRTSTRACLHGSHVACGIQQHQPSLTPLSHVTFKLLDTT